VRDRFDDAAAAERDGMEIGSEIADGDAEKIGGFAVDWFAVCAGR